MKTSAGILIYRQAENGYEVLLCHPGGPFWKNKDAGAWSIPKGEYTAGEDALHAAIRELKEETGLSVTGNFIPLVPIKQKSGKTVNAWAIESDPDISHFNSNTFPLEWPPKSGKIIQVPEIDKLCWFSFKQAKEKILAAQIPLLEELEKISFN